MRGTDRGTWVAACRAAQENPDARQYTLSAVARILGVGRTTAHRWGHAGRFPSYRLGPQAWFVKRHDLRRFLFDSRLPAGMP